MVLDVFKGDIGNAPKTTAPATKKSTTEKARRWRANKEGDSQNWDKTEKYSRGNVLIIRDSM